MSYPRPISATSVGSEALEALETEPVPVRVTIDPEVESARRREQVFKAMKEDLKEKETATGANKKTNFHPFLRDVQKMILYETKSRYYLVGSNNQESEFRVLKMDRTESFDLVLQEDEHMYDRLGLQQLLNMINVGNRSKVGQRVGVGMHKVCSAFGVIGFVRFLEGYYILLITKRARSAQLGQHTIYNIQDTSLIYLPNEDARCPHPDESRYVKMFQAVDMGSNFYFSYSYDLTNTLQHNIKDPQTVTVGHEVRHVNSMLDQAPADVAYVSQACARYVWNAHLLTPLMGAGVREEWVLPVIHGFVDQSNISILGRSVLLTLVARRSNRYAGTRFLKRGANFKGDVANEVETEQIVIESTVSSLSASKVSSHVQLRGSVPGHWAQTTGGKIVPKPPIYFVVADPNGRTSAKHFNQVMTKYGAPVVVLNLVKKKEKSRRHESLLGDEFKKQVGYLNIFLSPLNRIQYVHLDMASCKKRHGKQVMQTLERIAHFGLRKTGIFVSKPEKNWIIRSGGGSDEHPLAAAYREKLDALLSNSSRFSTLDQTGVIRTNCVDCLDRTNTAQFVVGKSALGLQLFALGLVETPRLEYDCDCTRMLEAMYEDHGDTLALQYGGSQLIHRVKSYRKQSKWTSKANDITQTVKRYYSNTISDAEKQNSINLFLGVFVPQREQPPLWDVKEYPSDVQWHLPELLGGLARDPGIAKTRTQWYDRSLMPILPSSAHDARKTCVLLTRRRSPNEMFADFYRPFEFTVMADLFAIKMVSHSIRDYMPNCATDYSPFVVRNREVKRVEDTASSLAASSASSSFSALTSFISSFTSMSSTTGGVQKGTTVSFRASSPTVSAHSLGSESDDEDFDSATSDGNSDDWVELDPRSCNTNRDVIEVGEEVEVKRTLADLFPEVKRRYKWNVNKHTSHEDKSLLRRYAERSALQSLGRPEPPLSRESGVAIVRKQFSYRDNSELAQYVVNGLYEPNKAAVEALAVFAARRKKGKQCMDEMHNYLLGRMRNW